MATQASDIGDLRLIDLLREPEQPVTVIGQQPMPRGEAARSMIGIGIHVMPSYLPQPQTATASGVFPMTTNDAAPLSVAQRGLALHVRRHVDSIAVRAWMEK